MASVIQLNRSSGGVPKLPVASARITVLGLDGDAQKNQKFHGGPDRALCLYSLERVDALRAEGHPIAPGTCGENLTIMGLDWSEIVPGVRLRLGDVLVEVTSYTVPCKTIRNSFLDQDFTRISQKLHPGWSRVYARVLEEGSITTGVVVEIERD